MIYKQGVGFVVDEATQNDMAKLGIGRPPVNLQQEQEAIQQQVQPQEQQQFQEPVQQQLPPQEVRQEVRENTYSQPSTIDEDERKRRVDEYMKSVSGNAKTEERTEEPPQQQNDFFSNWFDSPTKGEERKEEMTTRQAEVRTQDRDPITEYRRGIVEESIKAGLNPEDVERTIATMTPEEQVVLAKIKMEYDREVRMKAEAPNHKPVWQQPVSPVKKPLVFNSLKPKPTPSIVTAPSANFTQSQQMDQSSVYERMIRDKFYR